MLEQPISDTGQSAGNPVEVRSENPQQNQGKADETDRKTEQESEEPQDSRSDTRSFLNAKQAAAYLNRDEKTIRNWISLGRISAEKVKGSWQIPKAELDAVLVKALRGKERETKQEQGSVRSSENAENKSPREPAEQETERETETPMDTRSDARFEAWEQRVKEQDRVIAEKDSRLTDLKSMHEKQLTEKDQRINEKNDRINDLKADREKDRELYGDMLKSARQLIQSLQSQVVQLEAPKQAARSNFEAVEVDSEPKQEEAEQGSEKEKKRSGWWPFSKN